MGYWTWHKSATKKIVDAHRHDFDSRTVKDFMNKFDGGYIGYVKSLGGVFTKYAEWNYPTRNKKIVSKLQFTEICEYVWGLYDIWGVDYSNGSNQGFDYNQYKGEGPFYTYADDARYARNYAIKQHYTHEVPGIDKMLDPKNGYYAITNCSQGVVQVFKKAGLVEEDISDPAEYPDMWLSRGYKFKEITNSNQLQVGDVLIYGSGPIGNKYNIRGWPENFFHTNIVGEVQKDGSVCCYDSGHGYTHYYNGRCRHIFKLGESPYDASDWVALRYDLTKNLKDGNYEWKLADGKWHCWELLENNGKRELKDEWEEIPWSNDVYWFKFNEKGEMLTGWQKLKWSGGTSWFHFSSNGTMDTGWQYLNKKWYYLDPENGNMYENGLKKIKEKWYCFDANGVMQTGTLTRKVKLSANGQLAG